MVNHMFPKQLHKHESISIHAKANFIVATAQGHGHTRLLILYTHQLHTTYKTQYCKSVLALNLLHSHVAILTVVRRFIHYVQLY